MVHESRWGEKKIKTALFVAIRGKRRTVCPNKGSKHLTISGETEKEGKFQRRKRQKREGLCRITKVK